MINNHPVCFSRFVLCPSFNLESIVHIHGMKHYKDSSFYSPSKSVLRVQWTLSISPRQVIKYHWYFQANGKSNLLFSSNEVRRPVQPNVLLPGSLLNHHGNQNDSDYFQNSKECLGSVKVLSIQVCSLVFLNFGILIDKKSTLSSGKASLALYIFNQHLSRVLFWTLYQRVLL